MQLPANHNTSIDSLLLKGSSSVFLSDWNAQDESHGIERTLISRALSEAESVADKYFFIDEFQEVKAWLSNVFASTSSCITSADNFAVSSNGTATIFLVLYLLNKQNKLKVLLLTPIYFSYIKLLNDMSASIEYMQVIHDGKLECGMDKILDIIESSDINLIIINDPIFGAGISFGDNNYESLADICKERNVTLLIDYVYGGMEWNGTPAIINNHLASMPFNNEKVIFVESISKRIFLNGIKTSLVFAKPRLIKEFELASVYTIGTLTSPQVSMLKQIYAPENKESIMNTIRNNISVARSNYELLQALLLGTSLYVSDCNSGYFCLLYIPYTLFACENDPNSIAEYIVEKTNLLTIPHERYLYFCNSAYCCRINLSIPTNILMKSINKIIALCEAM